MRHVGFYTSHSERVRILGMLRKEWTSYLFIGLLIMPMINCSVGAKKILIGGLFGSDESENVVNAFKYAVYKVRHERGLLRNLELHYDIQYLPVHNRFESSKKICEQLSLNTMAVFGPVNQDLAAFTGSACASLNIPHIETRIDASTMPMTSFSINLHPDSELLAKAYLDVIKHFGWNEMLIIYGDQIGLLKVQSLLRANNDTQDMTVIVRQADLSNMRSVLQEAKKKQWRHIVAELNITETACLLKTALQAGMIDSYHHYIINNLDFEMLDFEDYRHNFVNLTGFRLVNIDDGFTKSILFDIQLFRENTDYVILNGTSLPYQCALIFDAVYLYTKALVALESTSVVNMPNTTCDDIRPWKEGRNLYNHINGVHVKGLTGDIRLTRGRRLDFKLDIMELRDEGLQKTGTWDVGSGVNITIKRFASKGVFGNKTLKVTTVLEPPYASERVPADGGVLEGNDRYEGFCIDLLKEIAKMVGFDFEIEPVPDGRYGVRKDGQWDGIVRHLIDREADLAVAALTISYEREQFIDFTKPFLNLGISILFRVPRPEKPGLFSFMNPLAIEIWVYVVAAYFIVSLTIFILARFSPYEWYNPHPCNPETDTEADLAVAALTISYEREQFIDFTKPFLNLGISILFRVPRPEKPGLFSFMNPLAIEIWVYVVAAYFIVSLTIFILARFSPYEWYNPHPCNPETDTVQNTFTLSNSFWFCVGTLMQQGSDVNPRAVSTRIVGSTWWLFTLIIISSYTANLAAFLTVERMVSPIESAEDLAKQTDISYGTLEGGSTMSFFRDSTIETYQRMWNFMESKDPSMFTKSVPEGIARVEDPNDNYAYLMESTSIEYITQRKCNLMQVGGLLDSKGYGIATPQDSPLKDRLSMAVLNLQEDGKIQMLYNKWWKSSSQCFKEEKTDSKANALGVQNVGGIFVVLLGGLTLAIIVAFIEFTWNSKTNATEDKQSLCSEMAEELRFAIRCHGPSKRPKYKTRMCLKCKMLHEHSLECPINMARRESANGVIQMRDKSRTNCNIPRDPRDFELDYLHDPCAEFGAGGYLHVEYSDTDT